MIITLEGERPKTWNTFYAGKHWSIRNQMAKGVHEKVYYAVLEQHLGVQPSPVRVHIAVRAYFKNRPLDPCNIPAKIYIDGLHGLVIHDDTMKYVASVTTESHIDKDNPRVEIEITEAE